MSAGPLFDWMAQAVEKHAPHLVPVPKPQPKKRKTNCSKLREAMAGGPAGRVEYFLSPPGVPVSQLGVGVMIRMLGGNSDTVAALNAAIGRKVSGLEVKDDRLRISLEGGGVLTLLDEGQSCCESRYMRTDDKAEDHLGATLLAVELREAASISHEYEEHDVQFLDVKTSNGVFTCSSHVEHNGYYGGFYITASLDEAGPVSP